jgi:microcystin-dependent protein
MSVNNPVGAMKPYVGANAPTGYLLCDGASYLRADYPVLFAVIGTLFGSADGTHFNVPDAKSKVLRGYDSGDANFNAVGKTGGSNTINVAHSHTMNLHTHSASGNTSGNDNTSAENGTDSTNITPTDHYHSFTVNTGNNNATGSSLAMGAAKDILNPFLIFNWIIRAS